MQTPQRSRFETTKCVHPGDSGRPTGVHTRGHALAATCAGPLDLRWPGHSRAVLPLGAGQPDRFAVRLPRRRELCPGCEPPERRFASDRSRWSRSTWPRNCLTRWTRRLCAACAAATRMLRGLGDSRSAGARRRVRRRRRRAGSPRSRPSSRPGRRPRPRRRLELARRRPGDRPAHDDEHVLGAVRAQAVDDSGYQRHVRAGEDRDADGVRVLLDRGLDDLLGRLVETGVDDLHPGVAQRSRDDLRAAVVTVQAWLRDHHTYTSTGHVPRIRATSP